MCRWTLKWQSAFRVGNMTYQQGTGYFSCIVKQVQMHRNITISFISVEDNAYDDYILMQNQWWKISYVKFLSFRSKEVIWLNRWQMVKLPFNPPSNQTRTLWLFDLNKSKPFQSNNTTRQGENGLLILKLHLFLPHLCSWRVHQQGICRKFKVSKESNWCLAGPFLEILRK